MIIEDSHFDSLKVDSFWILKEVLDIKRIRVARN